MLAADGIAGTEQAVGLAALVKYGRFRRIQILGFTLAENTATETNNPAAVVMDREHDALAETIVIAAFILLDQHACLE